MDHSIEAYLGRLSKEKAEQLWREWVIENELPTHISPDLLEILRQRLHELTEEQKSP